MVTGLRHIAGITIRLISTTLAILLASSCSAQHEVKPAAATAAVLRAFRTHDIVMLGEIHWNKQEYEWLDSLVANPEFADRVDDIVMEIGNSLYQKSVDEYIAGKPIPIEDVQHAWQNTLGLGPVSPIYGDFYKRVREVNARHPGKHQMRILCGDPYVDWDTVKTENDVGPFFGHRDQWYAQVVKDEVIAKHHRALLIAGANHFIRGQVRPFSIEPALQQAGATTFVVLAGTNAVKGYDDLDHRFDSWPAPSIALVNGNWVGELLAWPVVTGGSAVNYPPIKLKDAADALLYLGPRDSLIGVHAPRAEVDGTPYGNELLRRIALLGFTPYIPEGHTDKAELRQFSRPVPAVGTPSYPAPPRNMDAALPPRPPSK